ncbi:MAG TPA: DUF2075 domain-containing protein [Pyrinomonadaceae bacterium]|nr:DUF2075 domain-containing protein [Pyrinomonadaceae bacterium]
MNRSYYSDSITNFILLDSENILGKLANANNFTLEQTQRDAWLAEIHILKMILAQYKGSIYFEYSIPRMGQRIDVVLLIESVIFVLEFKIGETDFTNYAIDQVWDYALDLKNFHDSSHQQYIAPILIATKAKTLTQTIATTPQNDKLLFPIKSSIDTLPKLIEDILSFCDGEEIDRKEWENGRYCPTPTIVEAAMALYAKHSVDEISRSDASAINLSKTSETVSQIITQSRQHSTKSICFVTGVPGAGKTLVGLNIANQHLDKDSELYSVFLSGNGPLVDILREALTRDEVRRQKEAGIKVKKGEVLSKVKMFIQNVHHFRDDCLKDETASPIEHVALFDEAQRAWNLEQTTKFMRQKKGKADFNQSEPEFLISCLDRHKDWAVIVCLVGGGQEIHTGEAGISEWIEALERSYPDWKIYISPRLTDSEYNTEKVAEKIKSRPNVSYNKDLHLSVSMRSFRSENVSLLVKQILDLELSEAQKTLETVNKKYPIVITRSLSKARQWLKSQARGSERYGLVVSSQAERLKPEGIFVKSEINPVNWFLNEKDDVRSSYYLEDVATEFHIQGLELDWVGLTWDADFRFTDEGWQHWSFMGTRWNKIRKEERKIYLKNAYRVLLTRARQGMVIVIPNGSLEDETRKPEFYDSTFEYLKSIGVEVL